MHLIKVGKLKRFKKVSSDLKMERQHCHIKPSLKPTYLTCGYLRFLEV